MFLQLLRPLGSADPRYAPACVEITPSREAAVGRCRCGARSPAGSDGPWGLVLRRPYGTGLGDRDTRAGHRPAPAHRAAQVIRARQVKLMTAGEGVTDSEEATGRYRGQLNGVQLWNFVVR